MVIVTSLSTVARHHQILTTSKQKALVLTELEDEGSILPRGTTAIRRMLAQTTSSGSPADMCMLCVLVKPPRVNGRDPRKTATLRLYALRRLAQGCHPARSTTALAACAPLSER